jgi:hypothetical protein
MTRSPLCRDLATFSASRAEKLDREIESGRVEMFDDLERQRDDHGSRGVMEFQAEAVAYLAMHELTVDQPDSAAESGRTGLAFRATLDDGAYGPCLLRRTRY